MTDQSLDNYLAFRAGMPNSKGFEVLAPDGERTWEFGVSCSKHGTRVDVHVEGEGRAEWARDPEAVEWFNRVMAPLELAFGARDGHYGSWTRVHVDRAEAMQREMLRHGCLRTWWVRTFRLDQASLLLNDVPPGYAHEEYSLNLRSLPGEDHAKVRYVELTACGPHEDGRHGVKALLLMRRGPNRCARWLDREVEMRGVPSERVPSELPTVHSYALDREPALDLWRAAATLDSAAVGLSEPYFTDAQASWTFASGVVGQGDRG